MENGAFRRGCSVPTLRKPFNPKRTRNAPGWGGAVLQGVIAPTECVALDRV